MQTLAEIIGRVLYRKSVINVLCTDKNAEKGNYCFSCFRKFFRLVKTHSHKFLSYGCARNVLMRKKSAIYRENQVVDGSTCDESQQTNSKNGATILYQKGE